MKLGFIGSGRMAEAIIKGLISKKSVTKNNLIFSDKDEARSKYITKKFNIKAADGNAQVISNSDVIILAVKPQVMGQVLTEIAGKVKASQVVISIAAGINLKSLEKYLPKVPIIRAMPNNPCLIGEGLIALCGGNLAKKTDMDTAEKIFSSVGKTFVIEEIHMNAITALSGSGPAFIYEVIDALTDGGMEAGLTKELASTLAQLTMLGSVRTILKTKMTPEELKAMVASPGGTTVAGLRVLEAAKFKAALQEAVIKAAIRAKDISEEFERSL